MTTVVAALRIKACSCMRCSRVYVAGFARGYGAYAIWAKRRVSGGPRLCPPCELVSR